MNEEPAVIEPRVEEIRGARRLVARLRANKALRATIRALLLGLVSFGPLP